MSPTAPSHTKKVGIVGLGFYVPEKVLTNHDLERMVETSDEWIKTRTGIEERRIAERGQGTSDLSAEAAKRAMKSAKVDPSEIDLLIVATSTPDAPLPSTACVLQEKIGTHRAAAFDLAAACAGFLYGLVTAEQFIKTGVYKTVLVVGADLISSFIDWTDRSTCVLFGDGAAAAVLRESDSGVILSSVIGSDGRHADLLKICAGGSKTPASQETVKNKQHYLQMSGSEVFKLAVRGMTEAVTQALQKANVRIEDIACFIPHQANLRIIDAITERLKLPKEKIFVNLQKYGNTSAASCAIALCEAIASGKVKKKDKVVLATFGSGLVWGAMVLEW